MSPARATAAMTFLGAVAACAGAAPVPVPVRVEPGVYTVDGREVWLGGFTLDAAPGAEGACNTRAVPTAEERRVAARSATFTPSSVFEELANPSEYTCDYTMAIVEAEGVDGWVSFGGWGERLGDAEVLSSTGDPRDGSIRVGMVAWAFFGEDAKPAPRGARCITRDPVAPTPAWVSGSSVNVRYGRGTQFGVANKAVAGAEVKVWHREGDWAWIESPKSVMDRSGSEPTVHECSVLGWVKGEFLSDKAPDLGAYVREAEAAIAAGRLADAVVPLERAAALHPRNVGLREALAEVYAATKHEKAGVVTRQAAAMRAKAPRVPWSPGAKTASFATLCRTDPATAAWSGGAEGEGCLLPWSGAGATDWAPDAKGWIDLDLRGLQAQCGGEPTLRHQELAVAPESLMVKFPAGAPGRAVHIRRRVVIGAEGDGQFAFQGFGPWQTLVLRGDVGAEGALIPLPMADVTAGATMAVVLEVEVYGVGEVGGSATTAVQVVWPLTC